MRTRPASVFWRKTRQHFRWPAIAGQWAPHRAAARRANLGPCGTVLDCEVSFDYVSIPLCGFPDLASVTPCIEEGLLIPFDVNGETVGTIWIVAHDQSCRFDAEDLRGYQFLGEPLGGRGLSNAAVYEGADEGQPGIAEARPGLAVTNASCSPPKS